MAGWGGGMSAIAAPQEMELGQGSPGQQIAGSGRVESRVKGLDLVPSLAVQL